MQPAGGSRVPYTMTRQNLDTLISAWTPERIASLRGRHRMKQEPFALAIGYSHASRVSELEAGAREPSPSVVLLLEYLDRFGPITASQNE